jgi:hypothetical protein
MDEGKQVLQDTVVVLKQHLEQYAHSIQGVSCPPECTHFDLFGESNQLGCCLESPSPLDCLDADAGDLARWLVAIGWRLELKPVASTRDARYRVLRVRRTNPTPVRILHVRRGPSEGGSHG